MIVVLDLGEIFAGDAEVVGEIVVAGGDDELVGAMDELASELVGGVDAEVAVGAGDSVDVFVLADVEFVVLGDLAVVLEGLGACGLLAFRCRGSRGSGLGERQASRNRAAPLRLASGWSRRDGRTRRCRLLAAE